MNYQPDPAPGSFDHKGLDCEVHGDNVPFARPKGSVMKHECVQCLLEIAAVIAAQQEKSDAVEIGQL